MPTGFCARSIKPGNPGLYNRSIAKAAGIIPRNHYNQRCMITKKRHNRLFSALLALAVLLVQSSYAFSGGLLMSHTKSPGMSHCHMMQSHEIGVIERQVPHSVKCKMDCCKTTSCKGQCQHCLILPGGGLISHGLQIQHIHSAISSPVIPDQVPAGFDRSGLFRPPRLLA